jgi:hypothetical protein
MLILVMDRFADLMLGPSEAEKIEKSVGKTGDASLGKPEETGDASLNKCE